MVFKIDYRDDSVWEWSLTPDGATVEQNHDYTPTLYAGVAPPLPEEDATPTIDDLDPLVTRFADLPQVVEMRVVEKRPSFRHPSQPMVAVDVTDLKAIDELALLIAKSGRPGDYRLYNVDFSREFRYCLEQGIDPTPTRPLRVCELSIPSDQLGAHDVSRVTIDGETTTGTDYAILDAVRTALDDTNPDLLVVNSSHMVPVLFEIATTYDVPFRLGRGPGYERLAGESTYQSYGNVGHSPARYNVPGRALIDLTKAFFYSETSLDGIVDLVGRSGKPLQELGWASIGNVLTAIQIREATQRDVLVQWKAWRPERFKSMRQLHAADRGGATLAPAVGIHAHVHELDFASLYPNIICSRNLSPETVRCDCHTDREDLSELGYSICPEPGYLPDVLQPLIDVRSDIKSRIKRTDDPDEREELEGRSSAIKWILVSCFGYQGFSNAKFGRIEVHEAINSIARDILLDGKARLEAGGWEVLHGIVDSLWVTPRTSDREDLNDLAAQITHDAEIELEYEGEFEWVAFVPQRTSETGALTKYFGKRAGIDRECDDAFKLRGIESRQRSTPQFVAEAQIELIRSLDTRLDGLPSEEWPADAPEVVCDRLREYMARLNRGNIAADRLAIEQRTSKPADAYSHETRTVSALMRAGDSGVPIRPGQHVEYVVVNDDRTGRERVRLVDECEQGEYDPTFYGDLLIRATESILSPLGWRESDIRDYLSDHRTAPISSY